MVYVRADGPIALSPEQWIQAAHPERAEALSPGQRPGYNGNRQGALYGQKPYKLLGVLKLLPLQVGCSK